MLPEKIPQSAGTVCRSAERERRLAHDTAFTVSAVSDKSQLHVGSTFAGASLSTRCFLWLRSITTPYRDLASAFPTRGRILDLGSGHGLLALALALGSRQREIIGLDHDEDRVQTANAAALKLADTVRPRFETRDLRDALASVTDEAVAGVAMIDILHYFDFATQRTLINEAARVLTPGGILLVREIDADGGVRATANRLYEKLATSVGFTHSAQPNLSFRAADEWTAMLESAGFTVRSHRSGPRFLADVVFTGKRRL
jgi:SAM-dependent methyltransferase